MPILLQCARFRGDALKRLAVLTIAGLLLAGLAVPVQAGPVTFTISSISVTDTNPYSFTYTNASPLPSFTLDTDVWTFSIPDHWTGNLFSLTPPTLSSPQSGAITAAFTFSSPAGLSTSDTGTLVTTDFYYWWDSVTISWGAPYTINFGNGGRLQVNLNDVSYNTRLDYGPEAVGGTFTLLQEPSNPPAVPEPAGLLLFGAGMVVFAGALRRLSKNKN